MLLKSGIKAFNEKSTDTGLPNITYNIPRTIIIMPGTIVPEITPDELKKADSFIPLKFRKVAPQTHTQIRIITKNLFSAKDGSKINAIAEATNANAAGYHGRFSTHCIKIAIKPILGPKASLTHKYTPPACGHPEANSAETNAEGIKNTSDASER